MARVTEWRRTIVAAEAKRLRKTVIDLCVHVIYPFISTDATLIGVKTIDKEPV